MAGQLGDRDGRLLEMTAVDHDHLRTMASETVIKIEQNSSAGAEHRTASELEGEDLVDERKS